jgi:hypothetical protein
MAESLEAQSGRTEGATSGIRAVGKDESRSRSMFRVSAATIRGLTARRPRSTAASACSARWLDSKKVTVENAVPATGGRVFGASGTAARPRIPRSTPESKIRALKIQSRCRSRAPKRSRRAVV